MSYCLLVSAHGFVAVPEEVATPAEVKNQQRLGTVLPDDVTSLDSGRASGQGVSESAVKRHATMRCFPVSSSTSSESGLSRSSAQNVACQGTEAAGPHLKIAASTTERKLPRRTTTRRRKLSRKSTRHIRQHVVPDAEFDDDDDVDADDGEEVEFSETDSEPNDDDHAGGSDESDMEFETELARQMNASQVHHLRIFPY